MLTPELLLSDKFAEFSGQITALHERKKQLSAEFKALYEKHKADLKEIDEDAIILQNNFDAWIAEQPKK